jgi:hypothetical protein
MQTAPVTIATVSTGAWGLTELQFKVDKLNKRAARHGMDAMVVTVLREYTVRDGDTGLDNPRYDIEIRGCAPRINGWYLAARIENNKIIGQVIHVVPGKFAECDYSAYLDHSFDCDHCGTRRRRNDVYVLADDNEHRIVVGRNCLADYLRCEDAQAFADYATFCELADSWNDADLTKEHYEREYGGRTGTPPTSLDVFLTVVSTCTRRLGWTSRTACKENLDLTATADDAYFVLHGYGKGHKDFIRRNELYSSDDDKALAAKAIQWAQSLPVGKSEYLNTIRKIATVGLTDYKLAGYAASIIRAYQRDCDRQIEYAKKAADAPSKDYIGKKGERFKGQVVTILRVRYYESNFGVKTIVAMGAKLPNGSVAPITWFASGEKDFNEGDDYVLDASVKDFKDDAKYGKQTIVTRCKLCKV